MISLLYEFVNRNILHFPGDDLYPEKPDYEGPVVIESTKSVKEMRERARQFAPAGSLDFGDQGELNTNSGPVEYVFYRTVARACVFIRKYWSDPDTQGNVVNPLFAWVAGTSVIYATYCKPGAEDLQFIEINLLFNGIKARNLYWPNNMFASD